MSYLLDPREWAPFVLALIIVFPVCWAGVYTGQLIVWAVETIVWWRRWGRRS